MRPGSLNSSLRRLGAIKEPSWERFEGLGGAYETFRGRLGGVLAASGGHLGGAVSRPEASCRPLFSVLARLS